jgi:hemerythrin superfamily protein
MAATTRTFPSITTMIRMDHGHVTALFHRYRLSASPSRKRSLARNACLAIEIHAQLEEEIFYPALARVPANDDILAKSKPEHDEMRALIAQLRELEAGSAEFDRTFFELMRVVLHHVADEESTLLPEAERSLADQLGVLGMEMTKRRMQLLGPHAGEAAVTTAQSFPIASLLLAAGALTVGAALLGRGNRGNMERLREAGRNVASSSGARKLGAQASRLLS